MESEGPRVHKSPLLHYILGCFRTVRASTSCSLRSINKPHIHPSAPGTQTSLLVSTFSDSVFYVHPSHPLVHAACNAFPTPLVWRPYGNSRCVPRIM